MKISRRDFIKVSIAGAASTVLVGCQPNQRYVELEPYVVPPEEAVAGQATWYATTCGMTPAGNGIIVRVMNGRAVKIEGNPEHPLNRGKLDALGQAGLQLLYHPDRLHGPVVQETPGRREFKPLHWNEAVNILAENVKRAGAGLAIWAGLTTSGHLVDLFKRFAKATDAPAPVFYDLYAALHSYDALASACGGALPTYDIRRADLVFAFGDFLGSGPNPVYYGVQFGAFRGQALGKRGYLAQFEPRMSITGAVADRWVPVKPGHEALAAGAMARIIAEEGFGGAERAARAGELAPEVDVAAVAEACDLEAEALVKLARAFAEAANPVAIPGGAPAGADNGVEATKAVQILNAIAGVGPLAPGVIPPGITPTTPSTFAEAQALIEKMQNGEVQTLLVYGANPVYELPEAAGFRQALNKVETVVSFSPIIDETAAWAHMVLPERTYLEGWGYRVVTANTGRTIISSRQPVVVPFYQDEATGPAYSTGDVLLTIARGIPDAIAALPWTDEVAYLKQMVGALPAGAYGGSDPDTRWARYLQHGGWWPAEDAEPAASIMELAPVKVKAAASQGEANEYPLYLHVYTPVMLGDGRGASLPWLQGSPDPMTTMTWRSWVEINPQTAHNMGIKDGDILKVTSPYGSIEAPAYVYPAIRPDTVAIPAGQGHLDSGRYAKNRGANVIDLLGATTDATGENLAWSNVRVKVERTGETINLPIFEDKKGAQEHLHF
ncbi:MAG: molybdopterin-dependent oxidoreductase [Anaerolineae bacterium]|nr:molybdopterin-dependent oxidoreductase [Anaerolineae bacterium]